MGAGGGEKEDGQAAAAAATTPIEGAVSVPRMPVSAECKSELKFQLLQKHGDLRLNPRVERHCAAELARFCPTSRTLECLQRHSSAGNDKGQFSKECKRVIFANAREAVMQNGVDAPLQVIRTENVKFTLHCFTHYICRPLAPTSSPAIASPWTRRTRL